MGPFNVTITVRVQKKILTLNGHGHGCVFWGGSYHYKVTDQSRRISHIPTTMVALSYAIRSVSGLEGGAVVLVKPSTYLKVRHFNASFGAR